MVTGYVVLSVGSVQVELVEQAAVGAVVATDEMMLPVVVNDETGRKTVPLVKFVAETVTCQPAPLPVASSTTYVWCATVVSNRFWSSPFAVAAHPRALGAVRVSVPAVKVSVPVSVQVVPAATAPPHATA